MKLSIKQSRLIIASLGLLVFELATASTVFAQASIPVKSWGDCVTNIDSNGGVATLACVPILFTNVINFLLGFAGIVAMFMIAYAGFTYIISRGDQAKLDMARKTFLWAAVGLIFVFLSYFLVSLIGKFTGVQQIPH